MFWKEKKRNFKREGYCFKVKWAFIFKTWFDFEWKRSYFKWKWDFQKKIKEKVIVLKENKSFKKKVVLKKKTSFDVFRTCHVSHAKNVTSSIDKNEIHVLNDSIDCLSLTLSHYAIDHKRNSYFSKETSFTFACTSSMACTSIPCYYVC